MRHLRKGLVTLWPQDEQIAGKMKATGRGSMDYFGLVSLLEEMAGIKKE